jgi:uncharacterized protein YlxW (UPF0749 family)
MAGWLVPALKAVLPHVGTIITAAAPAFTRRAPEAAAVEPALLQQQVSELQEAASQNANYIRELAEQLQTTVNALEQSAALAEKRLGRTMALAAAAGVVALAALIVALLAVA